MSLVLDGTSGLSDIDGSAATPAIRGTDTNTGIFFPAADTIAFAEGGAEVARFDSSGNVGIGTSSPSSFNSSANKLVIGSGTGNNGATIYAGSASQAAIYFADGTAGAEPYAGQFIYNHADNSFITYVNGTTLATKIDSSGNLLVGTTSAPNTSFVSKSNFIGLQTTNSLDSSKWRQIVFATSASDATLYFPNGTNTPTLSSAGAWTNASDARQKTNIVDIKYGLDAVVSAKPRSYNRTDVNGEFLGFVAQELRDTVPEVVFGSDETSYSVDYGSLVAVAFKAIQEQQAIITALTARVEALENK